MNLLFSTFPPFSGVLPEVDAFGTLVHALLDLGARLTGEGLIHFRVNVRDERFAYISDAERESITFAPPDFIKVLADPDIRVVQVYMQGATGIQKDLTEIITYVSISNDAALTDRHPIAIWSEGGILFDPIPEYKPRAREIGLQVYKRFREIVGRTRPAYAAITSEFALECPTDLRNDPRSLAFVDFFVSEKYAGERGIGQIEASYSGAYAEHTEYGLYISCTKELNPDGVSLTHEVFMLKSMEVAKIIASIDDK